MIKQFIQKESTLPEQDWGAVLSQTAQKDTRRLKKIARIAPSTVEVKENPRSRSAWLRVAARVEMREEQV